MHIPILFFGKLFITCHALPGFYAPAKERLASVEMKANGVQHFMRSRGHKGLSGQNDGPNERHSLRGVSGSNDGANATVDSIVKELLARKDFLQISEICSNFSLDNMGCSRVKTYIGPALLNLSEPLRLKHKVHDQAYQSGSGEVTNRHGIQNATKLDMNNELHIVEAFARSFECIPSGLGDNLPFIMTAGDDSWMKAYKYPTLVRPAPVPDPNGNHVIIRINRKRHEDPVATLSSIDIPTKDKHDTLVWRGSISGAKSKSLCTGQWPNRSRILLVQKYANSSDSRIDISFALSSHLVQNLPASWNRTFMERAAQLKHKFIMVVEGNDVATNFEWVMASNSVPFMVKPVIQTWSLHSWVQPWKHYVPVEPDFSDLSAKLDWAVANPAEIEKIAKQGKTFMQEFHDSSREDRINAAVLVAYWNRFRITDSADEASVIGTPFKQDCLTTAWGSWDHKNFTQVPNGQEIFW